MVAPVLTEKIRNVLVLGHTGTGKSTLVEQMLRVAGHPAHGEGCPTVDHEPEERERGGSLSLAAVTFEYEGHKLNVLDAPGGAEVLGDAYPALLAADMALFVVDASVGIQPQHEELWRVCEARSIPRLVFLNKLDLERARYQDVLDDLRERYGTPIGPATIPLQLHPTFSGLIDVLHNEAIAIDDDGTRTRLPVPDDRREATDRNRQRLIEAIVENDDDLLMRYLDGETPDLAELIPLYSHGIAECGFFPVLVGAVEQCIGVRLLLQFLIEECPSPAEAPHELPHDGPTVAYVAKTISDQYVGRINLLRVLSGSITTDDVLTVERTGDNERLHQLFSLRGREQLPADGANAGDLIAVAKLDDVMTGDLLVAAGAEVDIDVPTAPVGFHRVVLQPATSGDDDKLSTALQRVVQEDPAIGIHLDQERGLRILSFAGPTHTDVTVARLKRRYGVNVTVETAPIDYRETIRKPAEGLGKHVKQSGGHGQFGVARIEVKPLARGEGFQFEDAIVGGVIPNNYIPSVEKGVIAAMRAGPLSKNAVVDVAVKLVDGKHNSVDSSDAAFQMAGILAFRDAVAKAGPVLLEPVAEVQVFVPDDLTGAIMSDLSSRRGRILGTNAAGSGRSRIDAHVPESELATFVAEIRALTSGRGEVAMRYDHHDEVPDQIAKRLLADLAED